MSTRTYDWWRAALDGVQGSICEDRPEPGFYRLRRGPYWEAVAIWHDGEEDVCLVGCNGTATLVDASETWIKVARYPVSHDAYLAYADSGRWPGDEPDNDRAVIGGNQPPQDQAALNETVVEHVAKARSWLENRTIISAADADRCEKLVAELRAIKKQVEERHDEEKRPALEEGRRIDAKWKPLATMCKGAVDALNAALTPYLKQRRKEKEAAAATAIAAGKDIARVDSKGTTSGTHGRKLSLRTVTVAEITDWDQAALFFVRTNPEVRELIQKLSDKCARAGTTGLAWMTIKTEERAQ